MNFKPIFVLSILFSLLSCEADYINNSRLVVEGKISSTNVSVKQIPLSLNTWNYPISEGSTNNEGIFKLGAPDVVGDIYLSAGKKIKSFTADSEKCVLSDDSLSIKISDSLEYVKFSNIILK